MANNESKLPLYAKNIKYLRKKSGLTQVQLGIKLNIANNTISQYEKGRRGTVSVKPVVCIVNVKAAISEKIPVCIVLVYSAKKPLFTDVLSR